MPKELTIGYREAVEAQAETAEDKYLRENPKIYQMFAHFTWEAVLAGAKDIGARAVLERMRWETNINAGKPVKPGEKREEFRLNNNLTPFLSRRFMRENPQVGNIFETRGGSKVGAPAGEGAAI